MANIDQPIFLVGSERSGTTLLRLMLDHHPGIAFNGEFDYATAQISDRGTHPEIATFREWLRCDRIFEGSHFTIDENLDYVELMNDFLNQKRSRDHKKLIGATVHHKFRFLPTIWPRAKYIYLYRDGRDVANSVMNMGWAGNLYVAADWWLNAEQEWEELRSALLPNNWIEVRYEDLIASTVPQLERVCEFLRVKYSDKMFDYISTSTYSAPDSSQSYRWRKEIPIVDVQRIEEKIGDRLLLRGYELSGHPRITIGAAVRGYLGLQARVNAFLLRLRRHGLALTLLETLSRRFGFRRAHYNAIQRINRITNANLK